MLGEPGAELTPFPDPMAPGWEDEDVPRQAHELVVALESTWAIVDQCLGTWTPRGSLESFPRAIDGRMQGHTRASVLHSQ